MTADTSSAWGVVHGIREAAAAALDASPLGARVSTVTAAWRRVLYVYVANALETVRRPLRTILKARGHVPNGGGDDAAPARLSLAIDSPSRVLVDPPAHQNFKTPRPCCSVACMRVSRAQCPRPSFFSFHSLFRASLVLHAIFSAVFGFFGVARRGCPSFLDFSSLHRMPSSCFWIFFVCTDRLSRVFGFFLVVQDACASFFDFLPLHGPLPTCFWIFRCSRRC